eukprot:6862896-Alexandrium_andersonii.AAC.1
MLRHSPRRIWSWRYAACSQAVAGCRLRIPCAVGPRTAAVGQLMAASVIPESPWDTSVISVHDRFPGLQGVDSGCNGGRA